MNLQNYNRVGPNYLTEKVKQISPSTQFMLMNNVEIETYISKYGPTGPKKDWEQEAKYFMELIQPLLDENYKLKDTVINLTEALKLDREYLVEHIRNNFENDFFLQQMTMAQLLDILKDKSIQYKETIASQSVKIEKLENKVEELTNEIIGYQKWKIEFTMEKEQEVVDRLKDISLQNSQIEQINQDLTSQFNYINEQIGMKESLMKDINEKLYLSQKQVQEEKIRQYELMKQLQNLVEDNKKSLEDQVKEFEKKLSHYKSEHKQKVEEMEEESELKIQDLLHQLEAKNEQLQELDVSYSVRLEKNNHELTRLQQLNSEHEKQLQIQKKQELSTLDNLGKTMIEKREKDAKIKSLQSLITELQEKISTLNLQILQKQSEYEQLDTICNQRVQKYKKKYKEKILAKTQEQTKYYETIDKMQKEYIQHLLDDHQKKIQNLDLEKDEFIKKCGAENVRLRDELEDLEFKMKDMNNMWDFKYSKLKVDYERLLQQIQE